MVPANRQPTKNMSTPNLGSDYTDEEREFMMAVDRYKRVHGRPYPTWAEILAIALNLGYRKVAKRNYSFTRTGTIPPKPKPRDPIPKPKTKE